MQVGVSVHISQLKYHGEVLWLNPTNEQLARGWKKGQGPATLCFGKKHECMPIPCNVN